MRASDSLPRSVLTRKAVVYVRQSTPAQVRANLESQRRQYDLVNIARGHGFGTVEIIDEDLGGGGGGGGGGGAFGRWHSCTARVRTPRRLVVRRSGRSGTLFRGVSHFSKRT